MHNDTSFFFARVGVLSLSLTLHVHVHKYVLCRRWMSWCRCSSTLGRACHSSAGSDWTVPRSRGERPSRREDPQTPAGRRRGRRGWSQGWSCCPSWTRVGCLWTASVSPSALLSARPCGSPPAELTCSSWTLAASQLQVQVRFIQYIHVCYMYRYCTCMPGLLWVHHVFLILWEYVLLQLHVYTCTCVYICTCTCIYSTWTIILCMCVHMLLCPGFVCFLTLHTQFFNYTYNHIIIYSLLCVYMHAHVHCVYNYILTSTTAAHVGSSILKSQLLLSGRVEINVNLALGYLQVMTNIDFFLYRACMDILQVEFTHLLIHTHTQYCYILYMYVHVRTYIIHTHTIHTPYTHTHTQYCHIHNIYVHANMNCSTM